MSKENSDLRRENLKLSDQINSNKLTITQLKGQIDALNNKLNTPTPAIPGVKKTDLPVVTRIDFGKYTGPFDTSGDGKDDTVRIYLHLYDQRGRFLPAVGKAVVQIVTIKPDAAPRQLAAKTYNPKAFTDAYVAGLAGTHFTLELSIADALPKDMNQATIKVTYTDAATGATFTKQIPAKASGGD